jgi:phospholipid transport system transporter-binding protein
MSRSSTEPSTDIGPSAEIKFSADNRLLVSGELSFKSVPALAAKSRNFFKDSNSFDVDLVDVKRADSAGVALLIEWQRQAKQQNKSINFYNIPSQMLAIARLSGVDELLSLKN